VELLSIPKKLDLSATHRLQVQMLAQKGRLAVVFSDEALAYGVNMPFRSCIFCGDMGNDLTLLIAQQMQGRAGRRGLDVQGSVIYLGMDWPHTHFFFTALLSGITAGFGCLERSRQ
jgi:ATP-dependent RNA helicase DDX60